MRGSSRSKTLGLAKQTLAVKGTRDIGKRDLKLNDATPHIEVDPETYEVRADGGVALTLMRPEGVRTTVLLRAGGEERQLS